MKTSPTYALIEEVGEVHGVFFFLAILQSMEEMEIYTVPPWSSGIYSKKVKVFIDCVMKSCMNAPLFLLLL
jgi:hypothetical protein